SPRCARGASARRRSARTGSPRRRSRSPRSASASARSTRPEAMFHDAARFGFVARLEENWRVIRQEMTALGEGEFMPWPERSIYGEEGWRTFGLYAFGQKQRRGCALCPAAAPLGRGI